MDEEVEQKRLTHPGPATLWSLRQRPILSHKGIGMEASVVVVGGGNRFLGQHIQALPVVAQLVRASSSSNKNITN